MTDQEDKIEKGLAQQAAWLRGEPGAKPLYWRGENFAGANFAGVNFTGATLRACCFVDANFAGANLTGADLHLSEFTGADLSGVTVGHLTIPVIPSIDAAILRAIQQPGNELDMSEWHFCDTAHCRAGWAIVLAGAAGRALEDAIGAAAAGALIYTASGSFARAGLLRKRGRSNRGHGSACARAAHYGVHMTTIKGTPPGYEDAVEEGPTGWAVWKDRGLGPPCPECAAPYDLHDPAHALVCPSCDRPGCDHCMPLGRGCECPECEESYDD